MTGKVKTRPWLGLMAAPLMLAAHAGADAADLKIGVIHALTGPYAFVGVPSANAIRMAADEINASGMLGDDRIQLVIEDSNSTNAQSIALMTRFGRDAGTLMVIGPTSSIEALATGPVANDVKVPMFTLGISGEILKAGPWAFKGTLEPTQFVSDIARFAVEELKVKRCAVLYNVKNEANIGQRNAFISYVKQHGVEIVSDDGFVGTDDDFSALATRVVGLKPDCVHIDGQAANSAVINLQLRQAGLPSSTHIIGTTTEATQQYLDIAGKAADGTFMSADFVPGGRDEKGRAFVANFEKRFGVRADNYAAVSYTMMYVAAEVLKNVGANPDREKIRQAMTTIKDLPVIIGDGLYSIEADRRVNYKVALMTVKDGKFVVIPGGKLPK